MYVLNKTLAPIHINGNRLLPGANVIDKIDEDHPIIKGLIDEGSLVIVAEDKASVSEKREMVNECYNESTLDKVENSLGDDKETLGDAVKKRRKTIKDFDAEVEAASSKEK